MIPVALTALSDLCAMADEVRAIVEHANIESQQKAKFAELLTEFVQLVNQSNTEGLKKLAARVSEEYPRLLAQKKDPVHEIPPELAEILKMLNKES